MGQETAIGWTDHTFSPWWGCTKVSPGCANCYAETFDRRVHGKSKHVNAKGETREPHWGKDAPRRFFGDKHWAEPLKWNREAEKAGVRRRVFCASMADVFEDREDLFVPRRRLLSLIDRTPALDWLLLTKRPENIDRLIEPWCEGEGSQPPSNIWYGTTCEDQRRANERVNDLLRVPFAEVRFLSVEPMLGPVDLSPWLDAEGYDPDTTPEVSALPPVSWVIVGGESGPRRRPLDPAWVESIADQCEAAGVPCFVKQDAGPQPGKQGRLSDRVWALKQFPTQPTQPATRGEE